MNRCEQLKPLFSDYTDNTLRKAEADQMRRHFEQCPECRNTMKTLKRLKSVLSGLKKIAPSPDFDMILRTRIRIEASMERKRILSNLWGGSLRIPAYAASLAIVLVCALIIWDQFGTNSRTETAKPFTAIATVNGQEVAVADSEFGIFNREEQTHYEMTQMNLRSFISESLSERKHNPDSLLKYQKQKSGYNLKRYQPVNHVRF
ncbi:zf-HC2 domain-containing protein [candidate division KSB1 bacterium]|nr:zf-HC2 domain-containing protein [candidate division KSB1 bacterium]